MITTVRALLISIAYVAVLIWTRVDREEVAYLWRCWTLEPLAPVELDGRRLVDIPDIASPKMQLANIRLSSGCYDFAEPAVKNLLKREPANPEALYVLARLLWVREGSAMAENRILDLVRTHPEFASGHVLLSGVRIDQGRFDEAARILDEVEPFARDDVWVWLNRMRIEAFNAPSESVRERLRSVLTNAEFPPNVRDSAAYQLRRTQYVSLPQMEDTYAVRLGFESSQRFACKLRDYAFWLMESQGRFDDGIAVIESHVGRNFECPGLLGNAWDFLAYGSLVKAAEIAPVPTRENQFYVDRARDATEGDFSNLTAWLVGRPRERTLEPFLAEHHDVDETDQYGRTRICNGVLLLNADTVRAELERGADPDGDCGSDSLVQYLTLMGGREKIAERQAVLRALLEHGAQPGDVSYCRREGNGVCPTALVPIFEEFGLL